MSSNTSIQTVQLGHSLANGRRLFRDINLTLHSERVGLVGSNGVGKSLLANLLQGRLSPQEGSVKRSGEVVLLQQNSGDFLQSDCSIARFLGVQEKLSALQRIHSGEVNTQDFDVIGDDWDLELRLQQLFCDLDIAGDIQRPCHSFSGGQLTRLQLQWLLQQAHDYLILDEPSNHLDQAGKLWLLEQLNSYSGGIMLISHDRQLLRSVDVIYELSESGLKCYGGHYDFYKEQKENEESAWEKQWNKVNTDLNQLKRTATRNREKAQRRAKQGKAQLAGGSQPKVLMDAKKDRAEKHSGTDRLQTDKRLQAIHTTRQQLQQHQPASKGVKLHLDSGEQGIKQIVSLIDLVLPWGDSVIRTVQLSRGEKVHLAGANGSGKSTLLKVLHGELAAKSGECHCRVPTFYLDQNLSLLHWNQTVLENLIRFKSKERNESELRTQLAGIGFRGDRVNQAVSEISGGERMKLSMLMVSQNADDSLLLLDEVDNHLDLTAKSSLANSIAEYPGSVILVCHDPDFVQECDIHHSWF